MYIHFLQRRLTNCCQFLFLHFRTGAPNGKKIYTVNSNITICIWYLSGTYPVPIRYLSGTYPVPIRYLSSRYQSGTYFALFFICQPAVGRHNKPMVVYQGDRKEAFTAFRYQKSSDAAAASAAKAVFSLLLGLFGGRVGCSHQRWSEVLTFYFKEFH